MFIRENSVRWFYSGFMLGIVMLLFGCSDAGDKSNKENKSDEVSGVFYNMEGVEYRTSSGDTGITGSGGEFTAGKDVTIEFFVGGILLGSTTVQTTITVVDFVPGATDESSIAVINLMRFLLSIDDDGDIGNGVQVTVDTRTRASSINFSNFDQTTTAFEAEIAAVAGDVLPDGVISADVAGSLLRDDLLAPFIGYYEGTFSGDDSGTWSITVNAEGGIQGEGVSTVDGTAFTLTGMASSNGVATVSTAVGGSSTGAIFTGTFSGGGVFSGGWQNTTFGESGSFSGNKTTPPDSNNEPGDIIGGGTGTSFENLSEGSAIFDTVAANFTAYENAAVTIKAPAIAENGAVIPVTVTFPAAVGQAWLFVDSNDEKVAGMANFLVASGSGTFGTRIKMKGSGNVIAVFDDGSGAYLAAKSNIKVVIGFSPVINTDDCSVVDCYPPFPATPLRVRAAATSGEVKFLASNAMDFVDYIEVTDVRVDDLLVSQIYLTPYLSRNPYGVVNYPVSSVSVQTVAVTIYATGNRSHTTTYMAQPALIP